MAGTGPGDLFDLAEELRDVCVEILDGIPDFPGLDDLDGAPGYVFVSGAAPIPECCEDGQLTVHVNNVTDRFSREAAPDQPKLNVPSLIVSLMRCLPNWTGEGDAWQPPSVAEEERSARQLHADGWALWNGIYNRIQAGTFLERCQRAKFVSMQSIRPADGNCGGWQLVFLAQLDGYPEDIAT